MVKESGIANLHCEESPLRSSSAVLIEDERRLLIHKGFEVKVVSGKGLFSCEPKWGRYAINCVKAFGPCESVSVEKSYAKKRAHILYDLYPT